MIDGYLQYADPGMEIVVLPATGSAADLDDPASPTRESEFCSEIFDSSGAKAEGSTKSDDWFYRAG